MKIANKKVIRRVTLRSLKENRNHTFFTILAIMLSTAMISAVCGFAASGRKMLFDLMGKDILRAGQYIAMVYIAAAVFGVVIVATSVIIASNAFRVSAGERTKQFGLLRSIGATKKQITAAVAYEGIFLCAVGIPLGLLLGNAIHLIGTGVTETLFTEVNASGIVNSAAGLHFSYVFSWEATALAVIVSFFTVLASAWLPAGKAARISPIDAIRQSGETCATGKSVKHSFNQRFLKLLFGCEGALAAKYVKRSRRSYRATVMALCISIVLFMAGSFFGSVMESSMAAAMPYAGVTAVAEYISTEEHRLPLETVELVTNRLAEFPGVSIHMDEKAEDGSILTGWLAETEDPAGFMSYAKPVLEELIGAPQNDEYRFNMYDASTITAGQRALTLAVRIFMFGFVALLVMIAVTNIVSTVVTNIRLRNREFALLRGIGMSKKNLSKMLRYEGLLSSVRALLFGIPLGSALVAALYFDAMQSAEFPFEYPWSAALISVVGVLAIVLVTTRIAERKIGRLSVIEALRE
jgi:ABC-type antimicrobial peptide transport system permease subunit